MQIINGRWVVTWSLCALVGCGGDTGVSGDTAASNGASSTAAATTQEHGTTAGSSEGETTAVPTEGGVSEGVTTTGATTTSPTTTEPTTTSPETTSGTTGPDTTGAPDPFCGDGQQDPDEECDDGNDGHGVRISPCCAIMNGVPLEVVGKMLGHRSYRTTQRYAHIADYVLRDAVNLTSKTIVRAGRTGSHRTCVAPSRHRRRRAFT